jgi:outer membrane protein assembly factor BamB
MTTDRNTRASFQRLDRPIGPDPAYAANLRAQFLTTRSADLETSVTQFRPAAGKALSSRKRRTRWFGLAAAAVLLIGLSGGLLTLAPIHNDRGPATIQAPVTEQPAVMFGGTAAQDRQFPGPNPTTGKYELASEIDPSAIYLPGQTLTYGNRVYMLGFPAMLEAVDLTTGETVWQREPVMNGSFAVTARGVVVTLPIEIISTPVAGDYGEPPNTPPFRVALLALETGDIVWQSTKSYGGSADYFQPFVLVDQGRVFVLDRLGSLFSLDLKTGRENWRNSYDQTPAPGLDSQICPPGAPPPGQCWDRSMMWSSMAIKGSTLYYSDPASATITALFIDDGSERWQVFTPDRVPSQTAVQWLVAFDDGVAVQLFDPEVNAAELSYVGFWTAKDGEEIWSTKAVSGFVASDGNSLYLSRTPSDQLCCDVDRVDAKTGKTIWSAFFEEAHVDGYLSSGTLILSVITARGNEEFPRVDRLFGIDVDTQEVVWRVQMPYVPCFPIYPVADNGDIACLDPNTRTLRTYRPVLSST